MYWFRNNGAAGSLRARFRAGPGGFRTIQAMLCSIPRLALRAPPRPFEIFLRDFATFNLEQCASKVHLITRIRFTTFRHQAFLFLCKRLKRVDNLLSAVKYGCETGVGVVKPRIRQTNRTDTENGDLVGDGAPCHACPTFSVLPTVGYRTVAPLPFSLSIQILPGREPPTFFANAKPNLLLPYASPSCGLDQRSNTWGGLPRIRSCIRNGHF